MVPTIALRDMAKDKICYKDFGIFNENERRPVGLYAAMAIGSELTQTTLNTFHTPGIINELVVGGAKRLHEILNNTTGQNKVWISFPTPSRPPIPLVYMVVGDLLSKPRWISDGVFECWAPLAHQVKWNFEALKLEGARFEGLEVIRVKEFERREGIVGQAVCVRYELSDYEADLRQHGPVWDEEWHRRWLVEKYLWDKLKNGPLRGFPEIQAEVETGGVTRLVLRPGAMPGKWLKDMPNEVLESNHLPLVVSKYGIEVGRQLVLKTLRQILPQVGYCHLELVADVMCWGGTISSITRYSSRKDPDVLKRISFEEARRNLVHACVNGEVDVLKSFSSRIVTSKLTETAADSLGPICC